jgi:hypothetical protein
VDQTAAIIVVQLNVLESANAIREGDGHGLFSNLQGSAYKL